MRLSLLLSLIALDVYAQVRGRVFDRACEVASRRSSRGGVACAAASSVALFEFAPAEGTGMGAACACTAPTGSKGEAMTFTRASTAWCTKGNETSGIVNGDLVECAANQPRIMPGGDGTGGLGISIWEARTNDVLRSQEFDNAAWASFVAGAATAAAKGTPNQDVAPDGTTTAERVTFAATTAAQSSGLSQTVLTAVVYSGSVYAKGNATTGSGSFDLCLDTAASQSCSTCTFVLATWTRCERPGVTSKASGLIYIGNLSSLNGGTTRVAVTPTLWQGQAEAGAAMGPPITTAGTAATRVAEVGYVTLPTAPKSTGAYSMAATLSTTNASTANWAGMAIYTAGVSPYAAMYQFTGMRCESSNGTAITATRADTGPFTNKRTVCFNDGANEQGIYDGLAFATPAAGTRTAPSAVQAYLGALPSGLHLNGVVKRVCADSSPTRCR